MENYSFTWSPSPVVVTIAWLLSAAFGCTAAFLALHGDKPGTLLACGAVLAGCAVGCYTSFARPRLAANSTGLRIRTLTGSYELDWHQVILRATTAQRLGRPSKTLEIDAGNTPPFLVVLGRFELAAEPADVLEVLNDLRGYS